MDPRPFNRLDSELHVAVEDQAEEILSVYVPILARLSKLGATLQDLKPSPQTSRETNSLAVLALANIAQEETRRGEARDEEERREEEGERVREID